MSTLICFLRLSCVRRDWSWISDSSAFAFQVLGFQTCRMMYGWEVSQKLSHFTCRAGCSQQWPNSERRRWVSWFFAFLTCWWDSRSSVHSDLLTLGKESCFGQQRGRKWAQSEASTASGTLWKYGLFRKGQRHVRFVFSLKASGFKWCKYLLIFF